jgi:ankyrin repeat protein
MKPHYLALTLSKLVQPGVALCLLAGPILRSAAAQTEDLNAAMMVANHRGDIKAVQALLDRGADPNARGWLGRTEFMLALLTSRHTLVAFWERQSINLNVRDNAGATLLMYAAKSPDPDALTFLLDHGADIQARDHNGSTALMAAVSWGMYDFVNPEAPYVEVAERLLGRGANINAHDRSGRTALMFAARQHHERLVQMLLKHGADVHLRDRMGRTALTWAASPGSADEVVRVLREHGATVGLLDAIQMEDHATVQTLLAGKVDVTERGRNGETALMLAAERGDLALVSALLAKGATPNSREPDGLTALILAFAGRVGRSQVGTAFMSGNAEDPARLGTVDALLKAGAQVNARDAAGRTPLLWALMVSTPVVVRHLLDAGADVNGADREGHTPMMAFLQPVMADVLNRDVMSHVLEDFGIPHNMPWNVDKELTGWLVARGTKVNAQDQNGNTVLHQIVQQTHMDPAQLNLLLEHGADANPRNRKGQTALMCCGLSNAHNEVVAQTAERLLERGADAFARDRFGATALSYALSNNCRPLVELLRSKGLQTGLIDAVLLRDAQTVRAQLQAGANANVQTPDEETLLTFAALKGDSDIVRALLAHGANANAGNILNIPILIMAIRGEMSDSLASADTTTDQAERSRMDVVRALVERGAKVNTASKGGNVTALMMAAALGKADIVRLLLTHAADVNRYDVQGMTALALVRENQHPEIEALLNRTGTQE